MTIFDWLDQQNIKGYDSEIVQQAFTHSSYYNEHKKELHDNERLEFLGDAVLQIWSADKLFHMQPQLPEGRMTTLRASMVCERALAEYAYKLGLNEFLRLGIGEERTGGRHRDSIVSDMFEAFIGALYLSVGMEPIVKLMTDVVTDEDLVRLQEETMDYKTRLQEYVQSDSRENVSYETISVTGPSNQPVFEVNVLLEGIVLGTGKGSSKKKAEQQAAKDALAKLVK